MSRPKDIHGQLALITGAGRGIGLSTALELSRAGARIAVGELDQRSADAGVRAIRDAGGEAHGYVLDVTDRERFAEVVAAIERELGPIDILVNNAGIMTLGAFLDHRESDDQTQLAVNLRGVINGMRAVLPRMLGRRSGHIVNIASMAGKVGIAHAAMYSATKFAVVGLTESVRAEHVHSGVDFSYVMPSLVSTELISGAGRPLWPPVVRPESVARAVRRAIENREVDVFVPRSGRVSMVLPLLFPRNVLDWMSERLGVDRMFAKIDAAQRAAYVARTKGIGLEKSEGNGAQRKSNGQPTIAS